MCVCVCVCVYIYIYIYTPRYIYIYISGSKYLYFVPSLITFSFYFNETHVTSVENVSFVPEQ